LSQAKEFAKAIGIENYADMKPSLLANKLRFSDPVALINACDELKIWHIDPLTISRPVIEDCKNNDGFLCDDPVDSWRTGNFAKVPILTGFMDGDGGVRALSILEDKISLNDLNKRFDELLPKLMEIEDPSSETTKKNLDKIKMRYFNGQSEINNETQNGLIRLYSERSFIAPLVNTVQQMVQQDLKIPYFIYKFSFKGPLSYSSFYTGNNKDYGPVHCDELIYLLHSPLLFPEFEENSMESLFRAKFVKFITDFAANG
jgi:juvenile-hormone esterase